MPQFSATSAVDIAHDTLGAPDGPPVVLLQGLGAQLVGWHPDLCRRLADAGLRIIRLDNRDVGLSPKFPGVEYTLADMAGDVIGLLDTLRLDTAHVVGQSLGGMIAQQIVIDHPDRVRSLGLIYTTARRRDIRGLDALTDRLRQPVVADRDAAIAQFVADEAVCASPRFPQDIGWLHELGGLAHDRCYDPAGVDRQYAAMWRSPDRLEQLTAVRVPTTILHGDSDRLVDPAGSRDLHTAIPGSVLTVYPGMGHELPQPLWNDIVPVLVHNIGRGEKLLRDQ